MGNVFFFNWEIPLMEMFQSVSNSILTAVATVFTLFGDEYLVILVLGLLYWCIDKELGRRAALALSGTMIFGTLIKGAFQRRRPYMDNKSVKCIRAAHPDEDIMSPAAQGFSMPSLHASMSVSVYGTLAREKRKPLFIALGILLPFFIGLSRVYLGVHYPTDVMLGWGLGLIFVFVLNGVEHKLGYKTGFISILIIGAVGFFFCRDDEFFSSYGIALGLLFGFMYEEKYVNFEKSTKWWSYIIRPVLGVLIFVIVSVIFKIPAKAISAEWLSFVFRLVRYAVATFVIIGPYPHLFKKLKI